MGEAGTRVLMAAVADVHAPVYLGLLEEALSGLLEQHGKPDLLLLVGDMVEKNAHEELPKVLGLLGELGCPIYACFGNEEYEESKEAYLSYGRVRWLDDEATVLELRGLRIGLVGSRGSLDRPTWWQRTHIPGIRALYKRRVKLIDSLLRRLEADLKIVMTHYAPTYETLRGERERIWPEMGCRAFENVMRARRPDLWLHGHAHKAQVLETRIEDTLVVNVSLPARRGFYVVDLSELAARARRPRGLEAFMS